MTIAVGLAAVAVLSAATAAVPLDGRWALQGSKTVFRLQPCGEATCGVLETSAHIQADSDARDLKNRDPQQRARRLKGLTAMEDLRATGSATWKGRIYVPGTGATYDVTLTRINADTLTAKGCMALLLCQTSTLTRLP